MRTADIVIFGHHLRFLRQEGTSPGWYCEQVSLTYLFVAAYRLDAWVLLGDSSRRAIIERLSTGPCTVTELAEEMPISRPAVSQHLKVLRESGVVHDEPVGRNRVYSIDAARLERYRQQLDRFWSGALGNLASGADDDQKETR